MTLLLRIFNTYRLPPAVAVTYFYAVLVPLLTTFTLALAWTVSSGELLSRPVSDDLRRVTVAWASSMLVACGGVWWLVVVGTIGLVMKGLGVRSFAESSQVSSSSVP